MTQLHLGRAHRLSGDAVIHPEAKDIETVTEDRSGVVCPLPILVHSVGPIVVVANLEDRSVHDLRSSRGGTGGDERRGGEPHSAIVSDVSSQLALRSFQEPLVVLF